MTKQSVVTLPGGLPLGFRLSPLNDEEKYYCVSKIRQHSKAEKSGLQVGDVVLCVNGISCENLCHLAITALTDISDMLTLLVLRGSKDPSEVSNAFASLGQSVRRLNVKEVSELTGNQNMSVTRRQSTGCISQTIQSDSLKQNQPKLFGANKFKPTDFSPYPRTNLRERHQDLKSDPEEKKPEDGSRTIERKRRERTRLENGSEKRHIVPSRLKNIAQTTEILEKEYEEELRRECNLQMFEERRKKLTNSLELPAIKRNMRCASEEPRYKTNMQFNLSTEEMKQKQKMPTVQTKVSIRRFSLANPGEKPSSNYSVSEPQSQSSAAVTEKPKSKLNYTPIQMKPLTSSSVVPRRAQFSIRSNSIIGIPSRTDVNSEQQDDSRRTVAHQHNQPILIQNHLSAGNSERSRNESSRIESDRAADSNSMLNKNIELSNKQENTTAVSIIQRKAPLIASSSTKQQIKPAIRPRSNSLSFISTGKKPSTLSSKFERPTNFALITGSNKLQTKQLKSDVQVHISTPNKIADKHGLLAYDSPENDSANKNKLISSNINNNFNLNEIRSNANETVDRVDLFSEATKGSLSGANTGEPAAPSAVPSRERKFSFSSRSLVNNPTQLTNVVSKAVKIENKPFIKSLSRSSSVPPQDIESFISSNSSSKKEPHFRAPISGTTVSTQSTSYNVRTPSSYQPTKLAENQKPHSFNSPVQPTKHFQPNNAEQTSNQQMIGSNPDRLLEANKQFHHQNLQHGHLFSPEESYKYTPAIQQAVIYNHQPINSSPQQQDRNFRPPSGAVRPSITFQQSDVLPPPKSFQSPKSFHSPTSYQPSNTFLPSNTSQSTNTFQPSNTFQPANSFQSANAFHRFPQQRVEPAFQMHPYLPRGTPENNFVQRPLLLSNYSLQQSPYTIQRPMTSPHNQNSLQRSFLPGQQNVSQLERSQTTQLPSPIQTQPATRPSNKINYQPVGLSPNRQPMPNLNVNTRPQLWRPSSAKPDYAKINVPRTLVSNQVLLARNKFERPQLNMNYQQPSAMAKSLQSLTDTFNNNNPNVQNIYATLPRRQQAMDSASRSASASRAPVNVWSPGLTDVAPFDRRYQGGQYNDRYKTN